MQKDFSYISGNEISILRSKKFLFFSMKAFLLENANFWRISFPFQKGTLIAWKIKKNLLRNFFFHFRKWNFTTTSLKSSYSFLKIFFQCIKKELVKHEKQNFLAFQDDWRSFLLFLCLDFFIKIIRIIRMNDAFFLKTFFRIIILTGTGIIFL